MRCVEAMTDDNPAAAVAGKYKTAMGAAGVIKRAGHATLQEFAAANFPAIHPSRANTGDLAAVPTDDGVALGIFSRDRIHVMRRDGLGTLPRSAAVAAFLV